MLLTNIAQLLKTKQRDRISIRNITLTYRCQGEDTGRPAPNTGPGFNDSVTNTIRLGSIRHTAIL
jgi:hypothetical protein